MSSIRVEQQLTRAQVDDIHRWAPSAAEANEGALLDQLQKDGIARPSESPPLISYVSALESLRNNPDSTAANQQINRDERRLGIEGQDSRAIWHSVESKRFIPNVIDEPGSSLRKR